MSSVRDSGNKARGSRRKGGRQPAADINLRDPVTLLVLLLVLSLGFGAAYAVWLRTWRQDQAQELGWYVHSSNLRIRDFAAQAERLFHQRDAVSLAKATASANRLEGCLVQIPRRGPVEWRAEMIGLAESLRTTFDTALAEYHSDPDAGLDGFADRMPTLRDRIREVESALEDTVIRVNNQPRSTNWTPETETRLRAAINAAREELARTE